MSEQAGVTARERARLRKLCTEATAGPWKARHRDSTVSSDDPSIGTTLAGHFGWEVEGPSEDCGRGQFEKGWDAHLIAAARTALPALLDAYEAHLGELARLSSPAVARVLAAAEAWAEANAAMRALTDAVPHPGAAEEWSAAYDRSVDAAGELADAVAAWEEEQRA